MTFFASLKTYNGDREREGGFAVRVVYADTLFIINFSVNYLIILATAKICGAAVPRRKIVLGALFGAAYAVLVLHPEFGFLSSAWIKISCAVLMLLIVFGGEREFLRLSIVFFAVSAAFGGAVYAASMFYGESFNGRFYTPVNFRVLVISTAVSYIAVSLVFKRVGHDKIKQTVVTARIEYGGRSTEVEALLDTGNSLLDPMTNSEILVIELDAVTVLFTPGVVRDLGDCKSPVRSFENLLISKNAKGFRLIPYTSVGSENGLLLAFKPDRVILDGEEKRGAMVAISPTRLSGSRSYTALAGAG